jgi:hypothetical protein
VYRWQASAYEEKVFAPIQRVPTAGWSAAAQFRNIPRLFPAIPRIAESVQLSGHS